MDEKKRERNEIKEKNKRNREERLKEKSAKFKKVRNKRQINIGVTLNLLLHDTTVHVL